MTAYLLELCTGQFQNRPSPPPRANPGAFDFFEKFWSNSPLCCQFRRSNAPPVRASKRVKSPTLQACYSGNNEYLTASPTFGNKFCKIFSHYEFLAQLVYAPHFKQRDIPRYNYINRQQQKNPGRNRRPVSAAHVLNQRITKIFCFRPLTDVLTRKSNAPPGGPHFGSNSLLYGA